MRLALECRPFGIALNRRDQPTNALAPPKGGVVFTDPAGTYRLTVAKSWISGTFDQPKSWFVDREQQAFNDNVTVTGEVARDDITLDQYLDITVDNAPRVIEGFVLQSRDTITLTSGERAGRLTFSGSVGPSKLALRFLAIIVLRGRRAMSVTLTATGAHFDTRVFENEPYLRTIEVLKS